MPCLHTHSSTVLSRHVLKNFAPSQEWLMLSLWTVLQFAYISHQCYIFFCSGSYCCICFLWICSFSKQMICICQLKDVLLLPTCQQSLYDFFFPHVLMEPRATSQLLSNGKTCTGLLFMNGLECERLAAGLLGVVVTLSTVSWLRNAIDDSYFYIVAFGHGGGVGKMGGHMVLPVLTQHLWWGWMVFKH